MTYKEQFRNSNQWKRRVLIMELFHLLMLSKKKDWTLKDTSNYFGVSIALVSENLKLAHALGNGKLGDCQSRVKAIELLKETK